MSMSDQSDQSNQSNKSNEISPTKLIVSPPRDSQIKREEKELIKSFEHIKIDKELLSVDTKSTTNNEKDVISTKDLPQFNYNEIAINMVQFQVEYHFSDENLKLDNYLLSKLNDDPNYWVPIKIIASLSKISSITEDINI